MPASLIVIDPAGHRSRVDVDPLPFRIGRHAANELILRDARASRTHARIVRERDEYYVEDAGSRHGVWVNGRRVERQPLHTSDRIEFGSADSYQLIFARDGAELSRLMEQFSTQDRNATAAGSPGANLAKLRAVLEVGRTLQTGFSMDDVLAAVVDAALAVTGAERGFLLLRQGTELETRVARTRAGASLDAGELRVPGRMIRRALEERRDLLSMNFDLAGARPEGSIADLELRSCVCVPLVRIRPVAADATSVLSTGGETVGVLYMDSRAGTADLAGGNRELLQSLAIEASTVLENARLLEEERAKRKIEEELDLARGIQQSLLPRALPAGGWMRAAGSSVPSRQVGGDYFDLMAVNPDCWSAVLTDVSGKGVGAALLASLLQGTFLAMAGRVEGIEARMARLNHFLNDRTGGEKYVTLFYCVLERSGSMQYVNAGHCAPVLLRSGGAMETLDPTGMPVGLIDPAAYEFGTAALAPGDKLVLYSDGLTEAQNPSGEFFGRKRLREVLSRHTAGGAGALHDGIREAVADFTLGAPQGDDLTVLVLEYAG